MILYEFYFEIVSVFDFALAVAGNKIVLDVEILLQRKHRYIHNHAVWWKEWSEDWIRFAESEFVAQQEVGSLAGWIVSFAQTAEYLKKSEEVSYTN